MITNQYLGRTNYIAFVALKYVGTYEIDILHYRKLLYNHKNNIFTSRCELPTEKCYYIPSYSIRPNWTTPLSIKTSSFELYPTFVRMRPRKRQTNVMNGTFHWLIHPSYHISNVLQNAFRHWKNYIFQSTCISTRQLNSTILLILQERSQIQQTLRVNYSIRPTLCLKISTSNWTRPTRYTIRHFQSN